MADKPFAIIGVNSDKDLDSIREIVKEKRITWRSFWNGEKGTGGPISDKWCVLGWPTTYLLDKDGVIRYANVNGEKLDKAIETLMAEMGEEVSLVGVDHDKEGAIEPTGSDAEKPKKAAKDNSNAQSKPETRSATNG